MEQLTILVVDDDHEIVRIISGMLRAENYFVLAAGNGDEALRILQSRLVHLIIMDVMMPKVNGLLATVKIREKSNSPILMLSAKAEESDRVEGLSMGADDYMTKPFYKAELLARVNSLLRRYMHLGSIADKRFNSLVEYYDLVLDQEKKKLFVRGEEVRLTVTEYKIMELMLARPSRVFPAEEIYESVWKSDAFSVENTVMIHISRLREKIEINPKKPEYIKVVWGIGYKIEKI